MRPRDLLPRSLRASIRKIHRALVLRRAIRKLRGDPRGSDQVWRELVYGWGNAGFSSEPEYLDAIAAGAAATGGAILECGSGLTTLVLATIGGGEGRAVWSLEADPEWCRTVCSALRRLGLRAELQLAPLRDYGDFDWYDVEALEAPAFSLVVCDGPTGRTRGGRFGLLPVLGDRLETGCMILLDDAGRAGEREVLRRWNASADLSFELRGKEKPYAVVRVVSDGRERAPIEGAR
jgi:hypothetical protein